MIFKKQEQSILKNIIEHRRDIRGNRFIDKEIDSNILNELLNSEFINNFESKRFI